MSGQDKNQKPAVQSVPEAVVDPQGSEELSHEPRSRKLLFPILLGLIGLGGISWVVFNRVILPLMMFSQMKPPPPTQVPVAAPQAATIEESSDYAASLDSRQSITLQPRVQGQINAIYVRSGDRIQAGKPILQIDAAQQQAQVASREAAVETAAAEIRAAKADVASARDNLRAQRARRVAAQSDVQLNQQEYERYQELFRQGAESRQILEQRLNAIQTAQAVLQQVEADIRAQEAAVKRAEATVLKNQRALEQAQAELRAAQTQLQYYTIEAPFDGTVGDIPVKVGDFVDTSTQLLTLTQNQELEIQVAIPLDRAASLQLGLPVRLLDDQNRVLQTGQVSFIAPNVNPSTQSILVKARFKNLDNLRTAQFVRARVVWNRRPGVLVPTSAISRLGGQNFIFVATPFKDSGCQALAQPPSGGGPPPPEGSEAKVDPEQLVAAQKAITLGKIVGNNQEVLEGINAGDRIVTAGILQLQHCQAIAAVPQQQSAQSP